MLAKVEVQGRVYIPIQDAVREAGWSQSYVGRLARKGMLRGKIIGGMWFLDQEDLRAFVAKRAKPCRSQPLFDRFD